MRLFVLDKDGEPKECDDVAEWARWYTGAAQVLVQEDTIRGVRITTAFFGIDPGWRPNGVPLLWETRIIGGDHDGQRWRYHTRAHALAGHDEIVLWMLRGGEGVHP